MSSYRRFITYLFWYENNHKKTNCGFAKVEQRQNAGKMELHIKNCPGRKDNINVYFFTKEKTRLPMILLGTAVLKKGTADALFKFDCNLVGNSSYSMEQIRGIVIPLEEGLLVASLWDDEMYDWSQLTEKMDLNDNMKEPIPEANAHSVGQDVDFDEGQQNIESGEEKANQKIKREQAGGEQIEGEQTEGKQAGGERIEGEQTKGKQAEREQIKEEQTEGKQAEGERIEGEQTEGKQAEREQIKGEQIEGKLTEKQQAEGEQTNREENLKIQSIPVLEQTADQICTWWKQVEGMYPKIYPFYGDKNVWGVQAQLRDIKYLPQKYWVLGNNSFLLHGYFNYGTILMGYMEEEKKYFIGVPGVFQNQERVLASLFGFPEFRTQQQCIQKTGEFGYWYRFLDI